MKDFMNKPWTWGTYFKMCGASWLLSLVVYALCWKRIRDGWE